MSIQVFISGLIVGILLGILLCYVALQYVHRQRLRCTKREIDRLTEQFQELFRQIDQDKQQGTVRSKDDQVGGAATTSTRGPVCHVSG